MNGHGGQLEKMAMDMSEILGARKYNTTAMGQNSWDETRNLKFTADVNA